MKATYFKSIKDTTPTANVAVDDFLRKVKEGEWQDAIIQLRRESDEKKQKALKTALPLVTVSGTFSKRGIANLQEHSGFIGMDIDEIEDTNDLFSRLKNDTYVYAAFRSCRGQGLCVLFKIDPRKHPESFLGLQEYFWTKYEQPVDPSGKDVSRARFVSYDPELHLNPNSLVFKQYPRVQKKSPKIKDIPFSDDDIGYVLGQINKRCLDITGGYGQWLELGFSFVQKFGEGGRDYFHQISQHSTLYDAKKTDKQYDHCLRHGAQKITIATFFHYAKLAGCDVISEQTKAATTFLSQQKRTKANKQEAVKVAVEFGKVKKEVAEQLATQVFDENKSVDSKDQELSQVEQLEMFLSTFNFRFNEVTRMIEYPDGRELKERELNDIWRAASKAHDFKVHFSDVERVLSSSFTEAYNPIHDFFKQGKPEKRGLIKELSDCIPTDTGLQGTNFYPEAVEMFLRKWLVGIVQSAFGQHSPLMLVLMGEKQNTGKTEFFRRLLPEQFKPYFMQSTLDQGKDDEINLCKNLLVLVDEYDSRTATDEKKMKRLLSQQDFTVRKPYGKSSERLNRLAVLCATSNDTEILTDPTGNRRYICVNVLGRMDFEKYNSIDKSELMMEAYAYYLEGERTDLTEKEIEILTESQEGYNNESLEAGLIKTYFIQPEHAPGAFSQQMTTTEIKVLMEHHSQQKGLSLRKIGAELKAMGYLQKAVKRDGTPLKCYTIVQRKE